MRGGRTAVMAASPVALTACSDSRSVGPSPTFFPSPGEASELPIGADAVGARTRGAGVVRRGPGGGPGRPEVLDEAVRGDRSVGDARGDEDARPPTTTRRAPRPVPPGTRRRRPPLPSRAPRPSRAAGTTEGTR